MSTIKIYIYKYIENDTLYDVVIKTLVKCFPIPLNVILFQMTITC